ncbi:MULTISPECIES: hypothetical protein [Xenorhabdus]|uniref:hypothetical protein n=1 Tax=Xenorhabdus TaxID=626 RepID=UPI000AC59F93|nr:MULTISPECIES: hypothetical protein [Xenorhabdus]
MPGNYSCDNDWIQYRILSLKKINLRQVTGAIPSGTEVIIYGEMGSKIKAQAL